MFRGEYEEILKVHDGSGDGHPISKYPARDPVNIPELRDTITRAKQCQQTNLQEEEKGNEGISMSVRQHKVPYDIQLLILGHLDNSTDIKNAVDEFKWDMTDPYWQRRFPDNFFFFFLNFPIWSKMRLTGSICTLGLCLCWTRAMGCGLGGAPLDYWQG